MRVSEIAAALRACGRTQTDLAEHLGFSRVHVSQMLSGKRRMNVDTFRKIEAFLAEGERKAPPRSVAEERASFERAPVRFVTLEEARKIAPAPPLSPEESEQWRKDILALGEAGRRLPPMTDMSDDEILGYDEMQ